MIDDKKIEEAATYYAGENPMDIEDQMGDIITGTEELSKAYKAGAKWAINESLKDLWHLASEEPKDNHDILIEFLNGTYTEYAAYRHNSAQLWSDFIDRTHTTRWLYIDDLLPKEGGEG